MTQSPWHPHEWKEIEGVGVRWNDLRFPFTRSLQGALSKPDFDYDNIGLLFPQNDATELVTVIAQMPHSTKIGTELRPHVHWRQTAETAVNWVLDYKVVPVGGVVPAEFTRLQSTITTLPYTSGVHQITPLGVIPGTGIGLSTIILCRVFRNDNTTTGDVLGYEFDIHYQIDSRGSREEFRK